MRLFSYATQSENNYLKFYFQKKIFDFSYNIKNVQKENRHQLSKLKNLQKRTGPILKNGKRELAPIVKIKKFAKKNRSHFKKRQKRTGTNCHIKIEDIYIKYIIISVSPFNLVKTFFLPIFPNIVTYIVATSRNINV